MWTPRGEQARVAARVRELLGEQPALGGSHRSPDAVELPRRVRWEPSRAVVVSAVVLVVLVVVATVWWYQTSQAPAIPVAASRTSPSPRTSTPAPVSAMSASSASSPSQIVVDVAGKVLHPGVYKLASGSRVDDAVRAAGGAILGVSTVSLNLAAPLHDGDEVVVGVPGAPQAAAGASSGAQGLLNLNTATADQLDALPGVGPVLAQHIIDWRAAHGGFASVNQLQNVSGIGDSKFSDLKSLVTV